MEGDLRCKEQRESGKQRQPDMAGMVARLLQAVKHHRQMVSQIIGKGWNPLVTVSIQFRCRWLMPRE